MRAATAIIGAGTTEVGRYPDRTVTDLASEAVTRALADAGIARREVDGLVVHIGAPRGLDYDEAAALLGLDVRFASQTWSHGRFAATVVHHAAMAVASGMADVVLCLGAYRNSNLGQIGGRNSWGYEETLRPGGGPHSEAPFAGFNGPVAAAAMAAQRYFHVHGGDREKLAAVPLAFRAHAARNPAARHRKPITEAEYGASPFIVEPLRLLDCSAVVDGAVALLVTRADRARSAPAPVWLLGMQGLSAGPRQFIFGQPGLGIGQAADAAWDWPGGDQPAYRMAGIGPDAVDLVQVYDAFSPLALFSLERLGHCRPGEALDFVQGGRIGPAGALPVNTSGGMLSEGHLNGWSQMMEMVRQLRGAAGERQVPGARIAQWGTSLGDQLILGAEGTA
ncbi:thiolase family protein [Muricoccus radiodurans]|uniref:thiolase family protein n=1 Tax=Muricoccus radiodurans TaxID=2231721 RepID=UPI003CFA7541